MLSDAVKKAYDVNIRKGDYSLAAELGQAVRPSEANSAWRLPRDHFHRKVDSEAFKAAADYAKEFGLPEDMVREAALQAFHKSMSFGLVKNAAQIAEDFELPEEMKREAAMKSYEQHMQAGLYRKALKIAQKYNLPEEMIAAAAKKIS